MMRLLRVILVLVVLAVLGLAGYAYFGDMAPERREVRVPVSLTGATPDAAAAAVLVDVLMSAASAPSSLVQRVVDVCVELLRGIRRRLGPGRHSAEEVSQ